MAKSKRPSVLARYQAFFAKPTLRVAMGVLALFLAYAFVSWAIDSGSLLDYAIAGLLLIVGLRELWDVTAAYLKRKKVQ